jgi:hypothetical protein
VALRTAKPADNRSERGPDRQRKASLWLTFKRLTEFEFPRRFPIVQFPNLPLIVALLAGAAGAFLDGREHSYAAAVSYLALTIWAYEELVHGQLVPPPPGTRLRDSLDHARCPRGAPLICVADCRAVWSGIEPDRCRFAEPGAGCRPRQASVVGGGRASDSSGGPRPARSMRWMRQC